MEFKKNMAQPKCVVGYVKMLIVNPHVVFVFQFFFIYYLFHETVVSLLYYFKAIYLNQINHRSSSHPNTYYVLMLTMCITSI